MNQERCNERRDSRSRLYFLDNVRWIMIARVAVFHVAAGYSALPEYFYETQAGGAIAMLRNIVQALPGMAVLFFVAGYFALPSLKHKTYSGFIAGKLYVLGIPYLLCIFFLGPMMPYLGYYSQSFNGLATDSYWSFWSALLANGFSLGLTPVVFTTNQQFHPMHFWFLSVLLQFFIVFALAHAAWSRWGGRKPAAAADVETDPDEGKRVAVKTLLLAALCMAAVQSVIGLMGLPSGLFFGIFQFQPTGLGTFGGFFALGIFAYSRGWFIRLKPPGWWALGVFLLFAVALGAFGIWLMTTMGDSLPDYVFAILYPLWMTAAGIWFLTVVIGLTHRYMNKPWPITARLACVSYPVYLIHYPLILVFRLLLLDVDLPTVAKFFVVLGLAVSSSVLLGHYLLRPRPRTAVAVLAGIHLLVLTIGLPKSTWSHELLERRPDLHDVIPEQRPRQVTDPPKEELKGGFFTPPPRLSVSWQNGRLYTGLPNGLFAIDDEGASQELDSQLKLSALAPRPAGGLFAIDGSHNDIVVIDEDGRVATTLVDSTTSPGAPGHLVSDAGGGLFFSAGSGDSSGVFYLAAGADTPVPVADVTDARGLALSANGGRLWVNASGDYTVWVFDVGEGGILTDQRVFAELFRGDGRYGRDDVERSVDPSAEGMAADRDGGLYVTTRHGLQVFSPEGRLLGVIDFPDVPLQFNRYRPLSCAFGGPEMSRLYVTCWQAVFALETKVGS
jgi:glucan biosynthesis protein C